MFHKIIPWIVIVLGSSGLLLSVVGIAGAWIYNEPLTLEAGTRLNAVDDELALAQTTLQTARGELDATLATLDVTEQALNEFTANDPQGFLEDIQTTLDDELLPELETARERLIAARDSLEGARVLLTALSYIPFLNINISDQSLTDLIDSADALQSEIQDVKGLAEQASTLLEDASFLVGGDLNATRESLLGFLEAVTEYEEKISKWRNQVADVREALPVWMDRASLYLTIFLLWFGLSQFSLFLHGLALRRGRDPLADLRV